MAVAAAVLAVVGALAACGATQPSTTSATSTVAPRTLTVYSSLPLSGPAGAQGQGIVAGIKLALVQARGRAGLWAVAYQSLDDSSGLATAWNGGQVSANAQRAAGDPSAVAYIGDASAAATAVALPTLNQAGVVEIVPAGASPALTRALTGVPTPSLAALYPAGRRTLLSLPPGDDRQAAVAAAAMARAGCARLGVVRDARVWTGVFVAALRRQAVEQGVEVATGTPLPDSPDGLAAMLGKLRGDDCVLVAGDPSAVVTAAIEQLHNRRAPPRVFATAGICASPFADPDATRTTPNPSWLVECAMPVPSLAASAAGRAFIAAYRTAQGSAPSPDAVYGYEAMRLALRAIARVPLRADHRRTVVSQLWEASVPASPVGAFRFNRFGESTLRAVTLYRVTVAGTVGGVAGG